MTRLGMVLYHGIDSGADLREYAEIAEGAGYESLWVTERYFHEETFSLLGFLAAATQDINLGLGQAMASATLDRTLRRAGDIQFGEGQEVELTRLTGLTGLNRGYQVFVG